MRRYLQSFRLPGEAQKIERILDQFSKAYYLCSQHWFDHVD